MNTAQVIELIKKISQTIEANKDMLTELDMPIGDSDHGINMARGFAAVEAKLADNDYTDIGALLKQAGMTLVSQVGGSAGPLYGTAFMNVGKLLTGKSETDDKDLEDILKVAIEGVQMRGKAVAGEATMLDAMIPAYNAVCDAFASGLSVKEAAKKAADAAEQGAESTIPMVATKGRASYVGERGIGHKDPGATSFALIMKVIAEEI